MNCQYFEEVINDVAREQLMDASARVHAAAHASVCARCSARLADERTLSAGLGRLAATASAEEAPARVEQDLLAAFRRQYSGVAEVTPRRSRRWPRLSAIAAAAAILIIVALAMMSLNRPRLLQPVKQAENVTPGPRFDVPGKVNPAVTPVVGAASKYPVAANVKPRHPNRDARPSAEPVNAIAKDANSPVEITTDFIPLMRGNGLDSMESGQMVRVELPRSALVSFGLPMNMERADERVKADVVIGNDGLARAIRFVR